jgi:hypothetical protein
MCYKFPAHTPATTSDGIHVLDLHLGDDPDGVMDQAEDFQREQTNLASLELIRVHDAGKHDYCSLDALDRRSDVHTVYFASVMPYATYPFPLGTGDVFVNIRYGDNTDCGDNWIRGFDFENPVDKSTFYFFMTSSNRHTETTLTPRVSWLLCLCRLIKAVAEELVQENKATFIFVGDPCPGGNRSVVSEAHRDFVVDYLAGYRTDNFTLQKHERRNTKLHKRIDEEMAKAVKFMTFWEMRKAVGEEMYERVMDPES